jgi:hypothetical protein
MRVLMGLEPKNGTRSGIKSASVKPIELATSSAEHPPKHFNKILSSIYRMYRLGVLSAWAGQQATQWPSLVRFTLSKDASSLSTFAIVAPCLMVGSVYVGVGYFGLP